MGLEAAMALGGAGSLIGAGGNILQGRQQQRRAGRLEDRAMGLFEQTQQPGFLESLLRSQFNVGQDGGMQMLRAMPGGQTLQDLTATGSPFDTSELFQSLQPLRQRQLQEGLGALRSTAPGLGQRFGSAMMRQSADLTERHLQNIGAQDAMTQFQAHEAAQGRRLGATQLGMGTAAGLMQLLGQQEQARSGLGLQALQTAGGVPQPGMQNFGQPFVDIGQMLLIRQLLGNGG